MDFSRQMKKTKIIKNCSGSTQFRYLLTRRVLFYHKFDRTIFHSMVMLLCQPTTSLYIVRAFSIRIVEYKKINRAFASLLINK